ncbi:MAG: hypothetical protein KAQ66_03735 [Rhodospirillaceae bacterium]|nr:hypothetical protein [Rhodospirillaceae bacterium]MCK5546968.1 hypothetical protein [Rhodospirillaceae bacterium]
MKDKKMKKVFTIAAIAAVSIMTVSGAANAASTTSNDDLKNMFEKIYTDQSVNKHVVLTKIDTSTAANRFAARMHMQLKCAAC